MLVVKIFIAVIAVLMLLGMVGANSKYSKSLIGIILMCCIMILAALAVNEKQEDKQEVTTVAPDTGVLQVEQNTWGTITVTDSEGITREYQGCIYISGTSEYETDNYMGLCVSMENAIKTGEWSPGMYKQYCEKESEYWQTKKEKGEANE